MEIDCERNRAGDLVTVYLLSADPTDEHRHHINGDALPVAEDPGLSAFDRFNACRVTVGTVEYRGWLAVDATGERYVATRLAWVDAGGNVISDSRAGQGWPSLPTPPPAPHVRRGCTLIGLDPVAAFR